MKNKPLQLAVPLPIDLFTPPEQAAAMAIALADSGVVDYHQPWDQLCSWWPSHLLWNTKNAPMASFIKDQDSWSDVYAMSAYYAAVTNHRLGTAISLDSVRRGPAEMIQTMKTLLHLTKGKSVFMIGGGEIKQCKPYGYKRAEGLDRMEDLFRINQLMWESDGPIDFQGHHWNFQKAWLGSARPYKPKMWALGGGPKLMEIATKYADGFATMAPFVFNTPEFCAERIYEMKKQIASHGRDPEEFDFCIFAAVFLHEDPEVIYRAHDNPLWRFVASVMGRINMNDWDRDGIAPPMPRDWTYATKLLPLQMTKAECDDIIGRSTHEMSEKSWICGTAQEVAKELTKYIDAGVTAINLLDFLPIVLPVEELGACLPRQIEVCRLLREYQAGKS